MEPKALRCALCDKHVAVDDRRDRLMEHNPSASHFTNRDVAEFFVPENYSGPRYVCRR